MKSISNHVFKRFSPRAIGTCKPHLTSPFGRPLFLQPAFQHQFTSSAIKSKDQEDQEVNEAADELKQDKRKRSRVSTSGKSTLIVAKEAQRRRLRAKSNINNIGETKRVAAYCAAETYNLKDVVDRLKAEGFEPDPYQTGLYPQVAHVQMKNVMEREDSGDLFIFPSGTIVTWNIPERITFRLINKTLQPAAKGAHSSEVETEHMEYLEDSTRDSSDVYGDTIILGTGVSGDDSSWQANDVDGQPISSHEVDTILAKIAFSSGLARSTKLAVLESLLNDYFDSTRAIPTIMSRGTRLPYTRRFILMKTGELLNIRAQLNLYSELTDSLPDMFWDSRHELGLEGYYEKVGRALDVFVRIRSLNEKLTYAQEIAQVLSDRLEEKHGHFLEWIIIYLIAFEILLSLHQGWMERNEAANPDSTENMLRQYLKAELDKQELDKH